MNSELKSFKYILFTDLFITNFGPACPAYPACSSQVQAQDYHFAMDGDDAMVGDETNPLEVAQDGVMSQLLIYSTRVLAHSAILKLKISTVWWTLSSPWMVKTPWSGTRPTLWRWLQRVSCPSLPGL